MLRSAGIYNVVRHDDSMKLLARKMKNIETTDATIIVANNPGCMSQINMDSRFIKSVEK